MKLDYDGSGFWTLVVSLKEYAEFHDQVLQVSHSWYQWDSGRRKHDEQSPSKIWQVEKRHLQGSIDDLMTNTMTKYLRRIYATYHINNHHICKAELLLDVQQICCPTWPEPTCENCLQNWARTCTIECIVSWRNRLSFEILISSFASDPMSQLVLFLRPSQIGSTQKDT